MSTFRPRQEQRVCKLNFDDKFFYELPLHENTARRISEICDKQIEKCQGLSVNDPKAFDEAYNSSLDALDEILGEGAGEDVMSVFDDPSLFDVADVINYIAGEFREAYAGYLNEQKKAGPAPNRAERRSAQRGRR